MFIIASLRGRSRPEVFPVGESDQIYNQSEKARQIHGDKVMALTAKGQNNWTGTFVKQICNVSPTKTRKNPNQGRVYDPSGISPALNCMQGGGLEPKIAIKGGLQKHQSVRTDGISPCLTSAMGMGGGQTPIVLSDIQIRKLTPLECWRLQGWTDEDFFKAFFLDKELGIRFNQIYQKHKQNPVRLMQWAFKHQKMSDSQLYKQAGNGVTVTVIQRIGERLKGVKENDL